MSNSENFVEDAAAPRQGDHWLNRKRLFVYPRMVLAILLLTSIVWVLLSKNKIDLQGKPLGYDFITFWAASHLALAGHPVDAYNIDLIHQVEQIAVPASKGVYIWYYPPSFFLLIKPLARLPYLAAYWVFMLSTFSCYLIVFRRVTRNSIALWGLAAFPGAWMNIFHGQNAFLTAALAAAALLCLKRRPMLAGVFIGMFAIKPHLALLFPVAMIAIGAWRTLIIAAVTGAALISTGTAVLGTATLKACFTSLGYARIFLETGYLPWPKMPTIFAFFRLLGMPVTGAYILHGIIAICAAVAVWRVWRGCADWQLRGAALMTATFLISPYVFDYDLAWLAFPIAWLASAGIKDGWLPGEREILAASWAVPMLMAPIGNQTHIQVCPFVLGTLLWMTMRKAGVLARREKTDMETPVIQPLEAQIAAKTSLGSLVFSLLAFIQRLGGLRDTLHTARLSPDRAPSSSGLSSISVRVF